MRFVPVTLVNTTGLLSSVSTVITETAELLIEMMTSSMMSILDLNFSFGGSGNFLSAYFGFLDELYFISQVIGFSLLFLIVLFSLFKGLTGGFTETESPMILMVRALVCCGAIAVAAQIMTGVYKPGSVLLDTVRELFEEAKNAPASIIFKKMAPDAFTKEWVSLQIERIALNIILLLFNALIFYNYIKLLLECVERWVVLAVLFYTSPIAFSLGASRNTVNVFKAWVRMVLSSIVMLCLNMAFVYLYLSAMSETSFGRAVGSFGEEVSSFAGPIIYCWIVLAILKTGQKLDQYCASLGMTTAQVGTMLGAEFFAAAMGIGRAVRNHNQRMHHNRERRQEQKQRNAEAAQNRAFMMDAKGLNPDGSQKVVNSGMKPSAQEMKNALQGKGAAFSGQGNAEAIKDMVAKAKDDKGKNPFDGVDIQDSSVTEKGCATINGVQADGTLAQYKLHTDKPDGVESTPLRMEDGSTMYLETLPVVIDDMPNITNAEDFKEAFSPTPGNTGYDAEGNPVSEATSGQAVFTSADADSRVELGSSYIERVAAEHGGIESYEGDLSGNCTVKYNDGAMTTLYPKATTEFAGSSPDSIVATNSGIQYYAQNHGAGVCRSIGLSDSQIRAGYAEATPEMKANISAMLDIPVQNIGSRVSVEHNGYGAMINAIDKNGNEVFYHMANSETVRARPNFAPNGGDPHYGYHTVNSKSGKGDILVCSGTNQREISRAFTPFARATALNNQACKNYFERKAEYRQRVAESGAMGGGRTPSGQNDSRTIPTAPVAPMSSPAAYNLNTPLTDAKIGNAAHISYKELEHRQRRAERKAAGEPSWDGYSSKETVSTTRTPRMRRRKDSAESSSTAFRRTDPYEPSHVVQSDDNSRLMTEKT